MITPDHEKRAQFACDILTLCAHACRTLEDFGHEYQKPVHGAMAALLEATHADVLDVAIAMEEATMHGQPKPGSEGAA